MGKSHILDKIKLNRWLNIRKTTIEQLNLKLKSKINLNVTLDNCESLNKYSIDVIADFLEISPLKLKKTNTTPTYIFKSKKEIDKSKRSIKKDGIHFYNYYTLPTPNGFVAPVLLDILCPKNKLPKLNNGHLEPAITVSIGPNDIYARFGETINKSNWTKFKVNKNKKNNWIVGSSYFEPSFCRHTYSQAEDGLGRIISYTTKSNIENFLSGKLNENSYNNFLKTNIKKKINRTFLKLEIDSKGFSISGLAKKLKISSNKLTNYFNNSKIKLEKKYINKLCKIINSDPSFFYDKNFDEDSVGKLYLSHKDSIKTIRTFKSYKVASLANSKRFPDLSGYFMKVSNSKKNFVNDLFDSKCSHYFVTGGNIKIHINENNEKITKELKNGDCIWISAFTFHGFTGKGSLLKISDGQNINYLEKEDLMNTYNVNHVLRRAKNDIQNWGYDTK